MVINGARPIFLPKFLLLNIIKDFAFAAINGIFNSPLQGIGLVQKNDCCEEVQYREAMVGQAENSAHIQ